jgi:Rrf2 family nitric oxide-sensitive transcriptional repressor
MQITQFSEYALRALLYVGLQEEDTATTGDIARCFGISESDLSPVTQELVRRGILAAAQGNSGGLTLVGAPEQINLGAILRLTEKDLEVAHCYEPLCPLAGVCDLQSLLEEAADAFLAVFDGYSLADVLRRRERILRSLAIGPRGDSGSASPA